MTCTLSMMHVVCFKYSFSILKVYSQCTLIILQKYTLSME